MNYESYGNKKTTRSRLARKQARRGIFVKNNKMKKLFKKSRAKLRRQNQELFESE